MTVATAYVPLTYAGNSATTVFSVSWPFFTGSLIVTAISALGVETVQVLTTNYSVSGGTDANGLPSTGSVTMLVAPATGTTLRIERLTPRTQSATWGANDAFPENVVEASFDKQLLLTQEAFYSAANPDVVEISISIGTVTTGAAGSSATVSIAEPTDGDFTLDFTIPRGDPGASGNGTGDVAGPASATSNAIALFNGVTGKVIKDSAYTITAAGAALLDDAAASNQRTTLGLGALATSATVGTSMIDNDAVTYAKMQNVSATSRVLGRITAGAGDVEELTAANVKTVLSLVVADVSGAAPLASPTLTGTPASVTAAADTNTTQIATTAYVIGQKSASTPIPSGTGAIGSSSKWAAANHVHPFSVAIGAGVGNSANYNPSTGVLTMDWAGGGGGGTCFPAGSMVLMGDGSEKEISAVEAGDVVWSPDGPTGVTSLYTTTLGGRKMWRMADHSLIWSEEHTLVVERRGDVRLWSMSIDHLMREQETDLIGGLTDWEWMYEGADGRGEMFMTVEGRRVNAPMRARNGVKSSTPLYLPLTSQGRLIAVNRYIVGAGIDGEACDYKALTRRLGARP